MIQDILKPKSKDELSNVINKMHLCLFLHKFEKTSIKGMHISPKKKLSHFLLNDFIKFYEKQNWKIYSFWILTFVCKLLFPIIYADYVIYLMYVASLMLLTETLILFVAVILRIRVSRWIKRYNKKSIITDGVQIPIETLNELIHEMIAHQRIRSVVPNALFYEMLDNAIHNDLHERP